MPRSARARAESGFYHVIQRGNGGQPWFEDTQDYRAYLDFLSKKSAESGISVLAYCPMSNHVHLMLREPPKYSTRCLHQSSSPQISPFAMRYSGTCGGRVYRLGRLPA